MTGFSLRVQDGRNGIWKTISRHNPFPVEVRSLDDVIALNGTVRDAASKNERTIKQASTQEIATAKALNEDLISAIVELGDRNDAIVEASAKRICSEIWWAARMAATRARETHLMILFSAVGLGVLNTLLVLVLILSR